MSQLTKLTSTSAGAKTSPHSVVACNILGMEPLDNYSKYLVVMWNDL